MTTLKTDCRKFAPNIFNKTKCQNCFRTKDAHSAEALESNRATRKVAKCGYLFVAPDWDFSVSINRTKRWQRRWFVLYDDGELTYSVDEHPDTVPQAVIDMNKVLEVSDAEDVTGNQFAIAITAPEKVHFVKGTSREESKWWFDALFRIPRNTIRGKHKRNATFPGGKATNTSPITDHVASSENSTTSEVSRPRFLSTSETLRRKDWSWLPVDTNEEEDVFPTKENGNYIIENGSPAPNSRLSTSDFNDRNSENVNNALNKLITSTVNNRTSAPLQQKQPDNKTTENSIGNDEEESGERNAQPDTPDMKKFRSRRYLKRESRGLRSQRSRSDGVAKMIPGRDTDEILSGSKTFHHNPVYLLLADSPTMKKIESFEALKSSSTPRSRHTSEKSETMSSVLQNEVKQEVSVPARPLKKSGSLVNISSDSTEQSTTRSTLQRNHSCKGPSTGHRENQHVTDGPVKQLPLCTIRPVRDTDSEPQVRTGEGVSKETHNGTTGVNSSLWNTGIDINTDDMFLKKGWLMRLNLSKEWYKHWFVLKNSSLTYYRDPSAEDCGILDGVLDLNQITSIKELDSEKNFAFCLMMWDNKKHILSAVTAGIRNNWIQAIKHASNLWDLSSRKDFCTDEIVLPEHTFHSTDPKVPEKVSISPSPVPPPCEGEKVLDQSSSDDQSEYFSIIDEEENGDRSSSPRALPPSPPVNRTPMSLVKERARSRSSTHNQAARQASFPSSADTSEVRVEQHSDTNSDHSATGHQDSPLWQRKTYKAVTSKLMEDLGPLEKKVNTDFSKTPSSSSKESFSKETTFNKLDDENIGVCAGKNLQERCTELEAQLAVKNKEIEDKTVQLNSFSNLKTTYESLVDKHSSFKKKLLNENKTLGQNLLDENYRLKYELLKTKYIRDRSEWDHKLKKEKGSSSSSPNKDSRENSLEEFLKVLQKTKQALNSAKDKFNKSSEKADEKLSFWKDIVQLFEEIERVSPVLEKKLKRDSEMRKLRKAVSDLQVLYNTKQKKLEEEREKLASLNAVIEKKDEKLQELHQELTSLKRSLSGVRSDDVSNTETLAIDISAQLCSECLKLKAKFELARDQIRKLKKELKESHTCYDDLEILCFKLKQDLKKQEEIHHSQISLMTARVDDLTSKYALSERNYRQMKQKMVKVESKQERRRSSLKSKEVMTLSKECEAKLSELEQKIATIEVTLKDDKSGKKDDVLDPSLDQDEANLVSERNVHKRLSQDSASGSESPGLLLRLHTLGTRVKTACDTVEKQCQECSKEKDGLERPKIFLQVRNDEESSVQEENGEDWSTLSFTTSMTDLQAIDGLDGEFPCTISECLDCLAQKIDGLVVWVKTALQLLQKQETGYAASSGKVAFAQGEDAISLALDLIETLDNLSDTKLEEMFNNASGNETVTLLCYKTLLLNETARVLQKIIITETRVVLEKICVSDRAFRFIKSHILEVVKLSSGDGQNCNSGGSMCLSAVEKLISLCNSPFHLLLDESIENFAQTSHQPPDRLRLIEDECVQFLDTLSRSQKACFSTLWHTLTDMPVQDGDQLHANSIHFSGMLQDQNPLLCNIKKVMRDIFEMADRELHTIQTENLSLLHFEHELWKAWNEKASKMLETEFHHLLEELKKQCPQINEGNMFCSSFSDATYQKIIYTVSELAQFAVSRTVVQNVIFCIKEQTSFVHNDVIYKEWLAHLHDNYYQKADFLGQGGLSAVDQSSGNFSNSAAFRRLLQITAKEMKVSEELEALKYSHQKKIETLQTELENMHSQQELLCNRTCEKCQEASVKLGQLQEELERISSRQTCCERCQSYHSQLQSVKEMHQVEVLSLREQYSEKIDELHKQLQLVLDQKDEAHLREVQKLRMELQSAHKRLSHLEVEYDEQIQSLKEVCEQKLSCKQDPINEESVRRRYQGEIEQLKSLCEKGLVAMENSHRRITLELERRHKQEIAVLEAEKEKALKEETQATLTALEVIRKAHAEELQKEIARFKEEFVKRTQMDENFEKFHREHGSQLEEIKHEILSLSEKYSVKCLESASLEERVEVLCHQLQETNHQLFDLLARNKQLKVHLAMDISQKKDALEGIGDPQASDDLKLLIKLRESELVEAKEENAQLKQDLHLAQMLMKKAYPLIEATERPKSPTKGVSSTAVLASTTQGTFSS